MALGYGVVGSQNIKDEARFAYQDAYPVLKLSNALSVVVNDTNAAIMSSIDGNPDFEMEVLASKEAFGQAFTLLDPEGGGSQELQRLRDRYDLYIRQGVLFGREQLEDKEGTVSIEGLARMKIDLKKDIETFRVNKEARFSESLKGIENRSNIFQLLFLVFGAALVVILMSMATVLRDAIQGVMDLTRTAAHLSEGYLDTPITINRNDEVGQLQNSFSVMRDRLQDLIENLDEKVRLRTQDMEMAQQETKDILRSINEVIFVFNADTLEVGRECSKVAFQVFPDLRQPKVSLWDVLPSTPDTRRNMELWLKLFDDSQRLDQWEKYCTINPLLEFERNNGREMRMWKIQYHPITKGGRLERVMLSAQDVTEERRARKEARENRQRQTVQMEAVSAIGSYQNEELDHWEELLDRVVGNLQLQSDPLVLLSDSSWARDVHTVKSLSGGFGMVFTMELLENLENWALMEQEGRADGTQGQHGDHYEMLLMSLDTFRQMKTLMSKASAEGEGLEAEEIVAMVEHLEAKGVDLDVIDRLNKLSLISFETCCSKYRLVLDNARRQSGKEIRELIVEGGEVLISKSMIPSIDAAVVHLIRNAVAHGIEAPEVRERMGKGAGHVEVRAKKTDELIIEVIDDGRGIDLNLLRRNAIDRGLIDEDTPWNKAYALELLTGSNRFSTKQEKDELSGFGVGLFGVKEACQELGGSMFMREDVRDGTVVGFSIPLLPAQPEG